MASYPNRSPCILFGIFNGLSESLPSSSICGSEFIGYNALAEWSGTCIAEATLALYQGTARLNRLRKNSPTKGKASEFAENSL